MSFGFNKVFKFTFVDWFKQKGILKYFVFLFVFYALVNFVSVYLMYSAFSPIASANTIAPAEAITLMVFFFTYFFALIIICGIVSSLFSYFLIAKALVASKKDFVEFSVKQWLRFIVLSIAECFAAMFSVFNLKLLLVPIAAIVLIIIAALLFVLSYSGNYIFALVGVLLLVIAFLLFLAYLVIWMYNCIRLTLSAIIFIASGSDFIFKISEDLVIIFSISLFV